MRSIPIARRAKTCIIGPGASEMTAKMLARRFDAIVTVRRLEGVPNLDEFDFVIRLNLDSLNDRTLTIPLFSNQR